MVPISPEIDHETKLILARAFDDAWARFLEREGSAADTEDNRRRLAQRIVALAKDAEQHAIGDLEESQLADTALIYLSVLAEAARLRAQPQHEEPDAAPESANDAQRAQAFGPDALSAMTKALELCLDELPLRLPSDVVSFLSNAIMARAATGDHDAASLARHALEALKAR
jgi:hypothetical protein